MGDGRVVACDHRGNLDYWCAACTPFEVGDMLLCRAFGGGVDFAAAVLRIDSAVRPVCRVKRVLGDPGDRTAPSDGETIEIGRDWIAVQRGYVLRPSREEWDVAVAKGQHLWGTWLARHDMTYCAICNLVKRADGMNRPCRGPIKLSLRGGDDVGT